MKCVLDVWDGRLTGLLGVSFSPELGIIKSLLILEHFEPLTEIPAGLVAVSTRASRFPQRPAFFYRGPAL